ncbi:hypothetical protein DRJ25_04175 [Candidatus Woesearchaeota archaeon]|nr:MAG: hypothetical protein DRJ25_04175 [Candidatus Woesearchaeota archaeon]
MSKTNISSSSSRNKTLSDVEFNNITPITTKLNLSFVFGGDTLNTSSMENSAEQYECYVEILAKNNTVKKTHAKINSKINLYINSTNTIENLTLKFEFKVNKSYKATIIIYGLNPKQAIHQGVYQEKNIVNITNTMNNTYNITDNITVKTKNESISTNKTITNYTINVINQNLIGLKPFRQQLIMNYYGRLPEGISKITPIFAFDDKAYNFSQAKIVLPKNNLRVDYILHCTDWNFTTQVCYSWEVKKPSYYNGFGENKTHFWFYTKHFDSYTAGDAVDLKVENISFNTTSPIEGQNITVTVNVSNTGNASIDSVELQLNISLWNGTAWVLKHSEEKNTSIGINDSNTTDFYWTAVPGTYKFNAYVDPYDSFIETNESNNQLSKNYTVPEWQIFYGQVNNKLLLADSSLNNFTIWTGLFGNIYLADSDFSVNFSALKPLNGTDDLIEADDALNITGFNDSIKALWDKNNDNTPDTFDTFTIKGVSVSNVPVVNSTNSSNFETGLLWDSSTGDSSSEYDGSQYLVIVTKIKNDLQGKYGVYDYEVRVPSALKNQVGTNELVSIYLELA